MVTQDATPLSYAVVSCDMLEELKARDPRRFPLMLDARDLGAFTIDGNTCTSSFDQMPGSITLHPLRRGVSHGAPRPGPSAAPRRRLAPADAQPRDPRRGGSLVATV